MTETYSVIYVIEGSLRPKVWTSLDEGEAIRFASTKAGARVRRDNDNAFLDEKSGEFLRVANHE